jgi:UDP-N-acetylmuramoyl-L-alanyl-D-glutamate--2,6-diaminopimelate ligase
MAATPSRPLGDLIRQLEARGMLRTLLAAPAVSSAAPEVRGISFDSRVAAAGDVFVAVSGRLADGHEFAAQAVERGAVAVIGERALPRLGVPQLLVPAARPALALAAAWFYGFPSHRLGVVGVTGTDGKTTTAHLIRSMLAESGLPAGLISTVDVVIGGVSRGDTGHITTPDAVATQRELAAMLAAGDRFAVVESTSHGLALDRVAEVAFDVGVLTNVTHEHLELHGTHAEYRRAKQRLFEWLAAGAQNPDKGWPKSAVINRDDRWADEFIATAHSSGARVLTYSTDPGTQADVLATGVHESPSSLTITARTARWEAQVALSLIGPFNVYNALAAIGVGEVLGLDPELMRRGLAATAPVAGRMERIDQGQDFHVFVDFAHTPAGLAAALDALAPLAAASGGGLISVFGSAGERDTAKRPMMGRVAGERSRLVVLTEEDARGEDVDAILDEMARGAEETGHRRGHDLLLIADRRQAIARALELARAGDVVLLAGKGHEQTMVRAGGTLAWDEAAVARDALAALGYGTGDTPNDGGGVRKGPRVGDGDSGSGT